MVFCEKEQLTLVSGALANIGGHVDHYSEEGTGYKVYVKVPTKKTETGPFEEIPGRKNWRYRKST